ncbi:4'-phosphopantetheinyl transferase superfamily protein [Ruminococcus flavefaciens]|uniref:4'-phosphopantetheinyl transferase family protein n=1 Tax=Ruminococcus flavefaciens TaxID=1265 RepID=UPI0013DA9FB9|nr:4'-phosphopantetheinyl transferase superfamily protein [Ruminococcus flavefaciens]
MGIDIEKISRMELPEAYSVFSGSEREMINALPQDIQADMFYRLWTLKESYVKKTGDGLHCPFDSFSFDLKKYPVQKPCEWSYPLCGLRWQQHSVFFTEKRIRL